ncbi:MAG: carbon storage regulator [Leptolyngbya sp. PLA1]|nr:carbon storage regulator [Leptolyngbya sp. PLA1]
MSSTSGPEDRTLFGCISCAFRDKGFRFWPGRGIRVSSRWRLPAHASPGWERAMLVITRREGEEVVIGDPKNPIGVVRIASVKGERVRIAFDFPRNVEINRREIADQIVQSPAEVLATIKPETA